MIILNIQSADDDGDDDDASAVAARLSTKVNYTIIN
jgi:hypothetical protein